MRAGHRSIIASAALHALVLSLFKMLRSIQGSQVIVDGGTFNDAAGNMNQTFTTTVSHQRIDPPCSTGDDIQMMTQVPSLSLHLAKCAHACYGA
jgi:hypothetical protein